MIGIHRLPVDSPHKGSVMLRVFTSWRHYGFAADGRAFGELALLSEDCIRTASVIADEHTDLIIINRDLYSRSMDRVMRQVGGEGEIHDFDFMNVISNGYLLNSLRPSDAYMRQ